MYSMCTIILLRFGVYCTKGNVEQLELISHVNYIILSNESHRIPHLKKRLKQPLTRQVGIALVSIRKLRWINQTKPVATHSSDNTLNRFSPVRAAVQDDPPPRFSLRMN